MLRKVLAFVALAFLPFFAQANDLPNYPFIHVSGSAMLHVRPDIGEIDIEITSSNLDSQQAWKTVEETLTSVKALLCYHNVKGEDLSVQNIESRRRKAAEQNVSNEQIPIEIFTSVHITVREMSKWQEIVTALMRMQNINSMAVAFSISNKNEIESQLVNQAIAEAYRKALIIAKGVRGKVGPVNAVAISPLKNLANSFGLAAALPFQRSERLNERRPETETDYTLVAVQKLSQEVDVIYRIK
ncbi:SIMPL domain-containing protein [Massilia aurea]|uniref:SIMPL domain-containing protein n=1 Tax=Massilia aurea TaxID=373040 RepID=UPI002163C81B|nr:SIMPL domain-containing protein [Massilia aurea]MCS0709967.1 SIMPL domain-containing protein [Massilia aurea]